MTSSFFSVCFLSTTGFWTFSRSFETVREARSWVRFLCTQNYVADVSIRRGGLGGEIIPLSSAKAEG